MANDPKIPKVRTLFKLPSGAIAPEARSILLGGLALVMVLIIAFTGKPNPPKKTTAPEPPKAELPAEERVRQYQKQVIEKSQRLLDEEARLAKTKEAIEAEDVRSARVERDPPALAMTSFAMERPEEAAQTKFERQSLQASNVAFSQRTKAATPLSIDRAPVERSEPVNEFPDPQRSPGTASAAHADREHDAHEEINRYEGKLYRIFEGTILETVLTNRLDGTYSGPVNCMVTTDVYAHDGLQLVIPRGTRVLGEAKAVESFGQKRLAVSFHRLIMPDGFVVGLDEFKGLNQLGETGLRDRVNNHYLQVFGASIAIGLIGGLSQANTRTGTDTSGLDLYRQGVATSLSQSSLRILDRYLNVLPTVTIREGHRVKIYLASDLLLPAQSAHRMPYDL